jgi:hypothetical protein
MLDFGRCLNASIALDTSHSISARHGNGPEIVVSSHIKAEKAYIKEGDIGHFAGGLTCHGRGSAPGLGDAFL